jgi:hypothetical protein
MYYAFLSLISWAKTWAQKNLYFVCWKYIEMGSDRKIIVNGKCKCKMVPDADASIMPGRSMGNGDEWSVLPPEEGCLVPTG